MRMNRVVGLVLVLLPGVISPMSYDIWLDGYVVQPSYEQYRLAHIIAGEASVCPFDAKISLAYVYERNKRFYGWQEPTREDWFISFYYRLFKDETNGAAYAFSKTDMLLESVQSLINEVTQVYSCAGGLKLYFAR